MTEDEVRAKVKKLKTKTPWDQLCVTLGVSRCAINRFITGNGTIRPKTFKMLVAKLQKLEGLPAKLEEAGALPPVPKKSSIIQVASAPLGNVTEAQLDAMEMRINSRQLELIDRHRAFLRSGSTGAHLNGARK